MATSDSASVCRKRETLKSHASQYAKLSKGIELSMEDTRNYENVRMLWSEIRGCLELYQEENSNLEMFLPNETADLQR